MTKTVVLPLDGSDVSLRAVPVARRLAATFAADLVLLTTPMSVGPEEGVTPVWLEDVQASIGTERARTVVTRSQFAVDGIVDTVGELDDPLLCMATHGRGRVGTTILGSVARDVVRSVTAPVVLVGPHVAVDEAPTGPLVVGHDGSPAADAVLADAGEWARAAGVDVVVVFVYHPLDVDSAQHPNQGVEHAAAVLREAGVHVDVRSVAGSYAVGVILDVVEQSGATGLAIGTHGRSGLGWVVLGSVAGSLIHAAPCPVLVRRPADLG